MTHPLPARLPGLIGYPTTLTQATRLLKTMEH